MSGWEADAYFALRAEVERLQRIIDSKPVVWAAQNTRTGEFYLFRTKESDVVGWINLQHQCRDDATFRKVALCSAPPAAEQPDTVKVLTAALKPFADAFEATGMPQYKGADEEHAGFLDENQITPVRGITMRQFRQAWEVLSGRSALLGKEQA